jgi:hypothetical protein
MANGHHRQRALGLLRQAERGRCGVLWLDTALDAGAATSLRLPPKRHRAAALHILSRPPSTNGVFVGRTPRRWRPINPYERRCSPSATDYRCSCANGAAHLEYYGGTQLWTEGGASYPAHRHQTAKTAEAAVNKRSCRRRPPSPNGDIGSRPCLHRGVEDSTPATRATAPPPCGRGIAALCPGTPPAAVTKRLYRSGPPSPNGVFAVSPPSPNGAVGRRLSRRQA